MDNDVTDSRSGNPLSLLVPDSFFPPFFTRPRLCILLCLQYLCYPYPQRVHMSPALFRNKETAIKDLFHFSLLSANSISHSAKNLATLLPQLPLLSKFFFLFLVPAFDFPNEDCFSYSLFVCVSKENKSRVCEACAFAIKSLFFLALNPIFHPFLLSSFSLASQLFLPSFSDGVVVAILLLTSLSFPSLSPFFHLLIANSKLRGCSSSSRFFCCCSSSPPACVGVCAFVVAFVFHVFPLFFSLLFFFL